MFLTAVCKIAVIHFLFISSTYAQFGQDYFVFVSSATKNDIRVVSDMHIHYAYASRDTIDVEINILENWKAMDSLKSVFVREISSVDTLLNCENRTIRVDAYLSASGDRIFIQKPEKQQFFDNYGQQQSYWMIDFASVQYTNSRKKYNSIFTCYYGK